MNDGLSNLDLEDEAADAVMHTQLGAFTVLGENEQAKPILDSSPSSGKIVVPD